ncbi:MAG: AAA family ATPase [Nitrospinae bacterium]|nr:AAA family ATPase [Nitrospinota bacterium]
MQIREIHVDGFGIFSGTRVTGLAPGLNIIYGPNEFGKTTLLEFVRRILFGFPPKSPKVNPYLPVKGGRLGGTLKCELVSGQMISIARQQGVKGGPVTILTDSQEHQGQLSLDSFLGHASREIFQNIYAFTVDELQNDQSLHGDDIQSRIYGAGMGLGEVSLGEVEKWLGKRCEDLFKPRGMARMGVILSEVKDIEGHIRDIQEHLGKFDELQQMSARLEEEKNILQKTVGDCELSCRVQETRRELYPLVVETLSARKELDRLHDVSGFPENGLQELASLKTEIENRVKRIQEEEQTHEEFKSSLRNLTVNQELLVHESDILFLQQSMKEVQSVIRDQVKVSNEWESMGEQVQIEIGTIGREWTEKNILGFELTEAEKSQIRGFYEALSEARKNVSSARDKLDWHREQKETSRPKPASRFPEWLRHFAYGLGGVGFAGVVAGGLLTNYILLGVCFIIAASGAFLYQKIRTEPEPVEEPEDTRETSLAERLEEAIKNQDKTFEEWHAWLTGKGLDEGLAPLVTEKIGDKIREIKNMIKQRDRLEERLHRMRANEEEVSSIIQKIVPALKNFSVSKDIPTNIEIIGRYFDEARQGREKKELLENQCRKQIENIDGLKNRAKANTEALSAYIHSVGAVDEMDFMEKHKTLERRKTLRHAIDEKQGYIQSKVGLGDSYDRFVESLQSVSQEEIQQKLDEASERLSELNEEKERLLLSIGETRSLIDRFAGDDELSAKQGDLEIRRQQLRDCAREWAVNRIAITMLNRAREKYEKERQPAVIKAAEGMFAKITRGEYTRIFKPVDSNDIRIDDGSGRSKGVLEMSRGTREQLYLVMRFGLIEEYESRSEPLPVVMDDVFVNFDDDRNDRVIHLLQRFAKPRQVIVLTCHKRTLEAYSAKGATSITVQ